MNITSKEFESCVTYIYGQKTLYEWFIYQKTGFNYNEFIKVSIELFEKFNKNVFFYNVSLVCADKKKDIISIDRFEVDVYKLKSMIRDKKLEKILNN
jgi:hypothetical protein